MSDYGQFQYASVVYPLTSLDAGGSLLGVADPPIQAALAYFASVITTYLGNTLVACAATVNAPITASVMDMYPIDPGDVIANEQVKFPLLAVWRKSSQIDERTTNWEVKASRWCVAYVLPPLSGAQLERISPVLNAVENILINRTRQCFDPNYQSGIEVWKSVGIDTIWFRNSSFGRYAFGDTVNFHAWTAELDVDERVTAYTGGLYALAGASVQVTDSQVQPGNPVETENFDTSVPIPGSS